MAVDNVNTLPTYYSSCSNNELIQNAFTKVKTFITLLIGNNPPDESDIMSLNRILYDNENIYKMKAGNILTNIKNEITNTSKITKELLELFIPLLGENNFSDMFNCKFIKNDLVMFFDQFLNHFAFCIEAVSVPCILNGFILYTSIYFIIVVMYKTEKENQMKSNVVKDKNDESKSKDCSGDVVVVSYEQKFEQKKI